VREGDETARFGGDEFIVFCPDCDETAATGIAKKIVRHLARRNVKLAGVGFTVSIGIAVHDAASANLKDLYRDADAALLQTRTERRMRIAVVVQAASACESEVSKA
jgi:diguanylate cyclase (GGDEF)-like protein